MRKRLPIFPLPDTVFFPETELPLHVFEPRYRAMVEDALAGEKVIGVQLLRPRPAANERGRPAVFDIGCAGEIVEHEPLEDGRSNIVLRGLYRYRIEAEIDSETPYRIAEVTPCPIAPLVGEGSAPARRNLRRLLAEAVDRLAVSVGRPEAGSLPEMLSDEGLVNEALTRLGLDTDDRYRLLTMDRLDERYAWVVEHVATLQQRLDFLAPFRRDGIDPRQN